MKKRNAVLAVALIALMTGVLSAQTYDSESDFKVTKTATGITITEYVGKKTAVNIPPTIQNLPVTIIGDGAFYQLTNITSVIIPNRVTDIGEAAFAGCKGLTSVTIGNSVFMIKQNAFGSCTSLTSVTFLGTVLSQGFSTLSPFEGDLRAKFYATDNSNGTPGTYTRPNGTSNTWTRQAQPAATTASSGDPESDFQVTKTATEVTITKYVGNKTTVNIPSRIQNLPVTVIGSESFKSNATLTSVIIPNGVTNIGQYAFASCASLTSVTIPNSVTSIGSYVFYYCAKLISLTIPNSVKSIGDGNFVQCTSLTSVTFQGTIPSGSFGTTTATAGDLRAKFYATDKANGTPGTYTRPDGKSTTWTKK